MEQTNNGAVQPQPQTTGTLPPVQTVDLSAQPRFSAPSGQNGSLGMPSPVPQASDGQPLPTASQLPHPNMPQAPAYSAAQPADAGQHPSQTPEQPTLQEITGLERAVQDVKSAIERTQSDPFMQAQAISRIKAEYLNTHQGQDIKLPTN